MMSNLNHYSITIYLYFLVAEVTKRGLTFVGIDDTIVDRWCLVPVVYCSLPERTEQECPTHEPEMTRGRPLAS